MGETGHAFKWLATDTTTENFAQENIVFKPQINITAPRPSCSAFENPSDEPLDITGPLIALVVILVVSAFTAGLPLIIRAFLELKSTRKERMSRTSSEKDENEMHENRFKIYMAYFSQWLLWFIRHFGTG
jgi:hypothetical protein